MKLLILLIVIACLQTSARGFGQTITLSLKDAPLEKVFKEIKKQSGYSFVYTRAQLKNSAPVSINVTNYGLQDVLELCFKNQPLSFVIEDRYVVIQTSSSVTQQPASQSPALDITGKVINEKDEPLPGVTVTAKNSKKATSTNENGEFSMKAINSEEVLVVTSIGYHKEEIPVNKQQHFIIQLKTAIENLDETIVIAYGATTQRLNVGNITKVRGDEIALQPVSNVLATLEGRVPGMVVTQTSGVPGSSVTVQIRGQSSLDLKLSRNDPLFVIDGVPFEPGIVVTNQMTSAANRPTSTNLGGLSPLNTINPYDIESIEVLKDADATAIYGSRGANGVILITTKKGKSGKTEFGFNISSGGSKVTRTMSMLNTQQYTQMRREGFLNDGLTPTTSTAPDILLWDTTRNTNIKNTLIGNAHQTDVQASLTGECNKHTIRY